MEHRTHTPTFRTALAVPTLIASLGIAGSAFGLGTVDITGRTTSSQAPGIELTNYNSGGAITATNSGAGGAGAIDWYRCSWVTDYPTYCTSRASNVATYTPVSSDVGSYIYAAINDSNWDRTLVAQPGSGAPGTTIRPTSGDRYIDSNTSPTWNGTFSWETLGGTTQTQPATSTALVNGVAWGSDTDTWGYGGSIWLNQALGSGQSVVVRHQRTDVFGTTVTLDNPAVVSASRPCEVYSFDSTTRITGEAASVGATLTLEHGAWTTSGDCSGSIAYTYEWQRCGSVSGECQMIPNATGKTYVITAADAGNTLRGCVIGSIGLTSGSRDCSRQTAASVTTDTTAPVATIAKAWKGAALKKSEVRKRGTRFTIVSNETCQVVADMVVPASTAKRLGLRKGSKVETVLGATRGTVTPAAPFTGTIRMNAMGKRALANAKGLRATIRMTVTDVGGNRTAKSLPVRIAP